MIKNLIIVIFLVNILFASDKMTFKEFINQSGKEIKNHYTNAKEYIINTHEKNKQKKDVIPIIETSKDVSIKALDKSLDLTIDAAKATKQLIKN